MHTAFSEHLLTLFSRHFHLAVALAVASALLLPLPCCCLCLAVASALLLPLPCCCRHCHLIMLFSTQLSVSIDGTEYAS